MDCLGIDKGASEKLVIARSEATKQSHNLLDLLNIRSKSSLSASLCSQIAKTSMTLLGVNQRFLK